MSVYVFLGPSLPLAEARALLDAHYLPPVTMGDVWAVCSREPEAIVIIDGLFERTPAVWHKELLYALTRGIPIYGGASMGALRAAELDAHGMIGEGWVYRSYRDGRIEADDEVAVIHGPPESNYRCLSLAMVTIRRALERAVEAGQLTTELAAELLARTSRRYYATRSWPALREDARRLALETEQAEDLDALILELAERSGDVKADDARAVLARVAEDRRRGFIPPDPGVEFEATYFWQRMVEHEGPARIHALFGEAPTHLSRSV